jgi:LPXTG-motif cell wall-anchored protein
MRRLSVSIVILALSLICVATAPQYSKAEPLPADYSGFAGGDVVAIDLAAAKAVDQAGNPSGPSGAVGFSVLAARADADPSDSLADTGGPQAWLPLIAGLGVLVGIGILAATRRRRRDSQSGP